MERPATFAPVSLSKTPRRSQSMQSGASDKLTMKAVWSSVLLWWRKVSSRRLLPQRRSPLPLDVLVHLEATMLSNGTTTFPVGASADNSWKVTINISRCKQARAVQLAACKGLGGPCRSRLHPSHVSGLRENTSSSPSCQNAVSGHCELPGEGAKVGCSVVRSPDARLHASGAWMPRPVEVRSVSEKTSSTV